MSPRWFTAIPLEYREGPSFWARDAGLLCSGFRSIGSDARLVAVGAGGERSDLPLILESEAQLASSQWWRQWNVDGVVIISWGLRRYEPIVRAIRDAKIRVVIKLDTDGLLTPRVWFRRYLQVAMASLRDQRRPFPLLQTLVRTSYHTLFARRQNRALARHLQLADAVTVESPLAFERFARGLEIAGAGAVLPKLRMLPHPVADFFRWSGEPKEKLIAAVGRWNAYVKGAPLLIEVLAEVLKKAPGWRAVIIGPGGGVLEELIARHAPDVRARVQITGDMPSEKVAENLRRSSIALNTSHFESFGIALAEALACGASIVGSAEIPSMNWFASAQSGTLFPTRNLGLVIDAMRAEIRVWEAGDRDPAAISNVWGPRVRVSEIARAIVNLPLAQKLEHQ